MRKRIFAATLLLLAVGTASAQEREIKVYRGGQAVYTSATSGNNRMNFSGHDAIFTHNGATWTTRIDNIDSLVFALPDGSGESESGSEPVGVDTSTAIRIEWNGSNVSIQNPFSANGISISADGGNVEVVSTIDSADIAYILSGSSTNGSLSITTLRKAVLCLNSLSLQAEGRPAIRIGSDKRVALDLTGTNTLGDDASNTGKGAIQASGKLFIQGTGTLNVSGQAKHAIQSSGRCKMTSGTVNITAAARDGMNVDDFVMYDGQLTVSGTAADGIDGDQGYIALHGGTVNVSCTTANAKGICCDSTLTIDGGEVEVSVSGNQAKALKTKQNLYINGGQITLRATGSLVLEASGSGVDPSYCSGIKANGSVQMTAGELTVVCPSTNAGGKCINSDGNVQILGGTLTLSATGNCSTYTDSTGTTTSYSSTCIKADGDIHIGGGSINATAGGRALSCDGNYRQTGGAVSCSTSAAGFGTVRYSSSSSYYSDGFAAACLKVDGDIVFISGSFSGSSTGTAGRGIRGKGSLTVGTTGATDSLLHIYVTTSGSQFSTTSSSNYWRGLPKGIKIQGDINVYSGHLQSYCSQSGSSSGGWGGMGGGDNGEAIETKASLYISGGYVEANSYDDAINAASYINISGGYVWAYARGNDGMDCNGTRIDISGGTVICQGTEVAIDDNGDRNGRLYITGGTVVLIGGSMGTTEATPSLTGQKSLSLSSSSGGWGGGWGGSSGGATLASNGFCVKDASGNTVMLFKAPTVSGGGFATSGPMPLTNGPKPPGGPGGSSAGVYITSPDIQSGTYTWYASPSISGGTSWHGLYTGATATTSGSGTSVTAQ